MRSSEILQSLLLLPFLGVHVEQVLVPAGGLLFSRLGLGSLGTSPPGKMEDACSKQ